MSRVVITGCGIVSPIGSGMTGFTEGLIGGVSGTAAVSCFDTAHLPVSLGAEARHRGGIIAPDTRTDRRAIFNRMVMDELTAAGRMERYAPERRVLLAGTSIDYFDLERYTGSADARENRWQQYSANSCTLFESLAAAYGIAGGTMVNVSACVASSQSVGLAFRLVRSSSGMVAVAGGCDSMLNPLHYMGFWKLGALSDWTGDPARCSRPFDRDRRGVVLGEGAAFYTIEREADADPAAILCEIAGYATTSDSHLITDPEPEGRLLSRAALEAIHDAGITPDDIDAVHAHGTGTVKNDLAECAAMKRVFGERYRDIPVFSLKAQIGHLIGACGAVEIAAAIHALRQQVALPTINRDTPDPDIDLLIHDRITPARTRYILKLNAAFGGQNTALVLKRYE